MATTYTYTPVLVAIFLLAVFLLLANCVLCIAAYCTNIDLLVDLLVDLRYRRPPTTVDLHKGQKVDTSEGQRWETQSGNNRGVT